MADATVNPQPSDGRDTIVAIATPAGRGGIGVVRLSGPQAVTLAVRMLRLRGPLEPNRARFCEIIDPTQPDPGTADKLDEGVATWFAAPRSYTGEDVVEIAAHGSPVLLDLLVRHTLAAGARLAEPGEFTERAFLAGRLDLTQAEAVRDLIDAQTIYQARVAAQQLDGALSRRVRPIKDGLIRLIVLMEAGIDFAEDDTPVLGEEEFVTAIDTIGRQLDALEQSFIHGRLVHSGLTLAIVGAPNVGKSSLFNRLVERERAIVTHLPGTTRDLITERVSLGGVPVELVDTAGFRSATDEAERLGIEKSREALADADLVLLVFDAAALWAGGMSGFNGLAIGSCGDGEELSGLAATTGINSADGLAMRESLILLRSLEPDRTLLVLTKCDLVVTVTGAAQTPAEPVFSYMQQELAQMFGLSPQMPIVATSAQTGEGIQALRDAITRQMQAPSQADQSGMLTNLRQHQAVEAAGAAVVAATAAASLPHEMILLDLYSALRSLDALTGETTSDDILHLIFSTFCIGK